MAYPKALKTKIDELVNDRKLSAVEVAEALNNSGVSKTNGRKWNKNDINYRRWRAGKKKTVRKKTVRKKAARKPTTPSVTRLAAGDKQAQHCLNRLIITSDYSPDEKVRLLTLVSDLIEMAEAT